MEVFEYRRNVCHPISLLKNCAHIYPHTLLCCQPSVLGGEESLYHFCELTRYNI